MIILNSGQEKAVKTIKEWWNSGEHQTITLTGAAGTGKTTVLNSVLDELNIKDHQNRRVAFTGKAALVMILNGLSATTIHQLIYNTKVIKDSNGHKKVIFKKKDSLNPLIKLIIIDEVSMVEKKILDDILSFGIRVIGLGDSNQLDPPFGSTNSLLSNPDIILTEPMRQALDNPILWLSNEILKGKSLKSLKGSYKNKVFILDAEEIPEKLYLRASQCLVCKNATRLLLNSEIRKLLKFDSEMPQKNDKIIFTKNNWDEVSFYNDIEISIVNGLIGYMDSNPYNMDTKNGLFNLDLKLEKSDPFPLFTNLIVKNNYMSSHRKDDEIEKDLDIKINYIDFGYSITVHKSQGSTFQNGIYLSEPFGRDQKKIDYTAVTRFSESCIIGIL